WRRQPHENLKLPKSKHQTGTKPLAVERTYLLGFGDLGFLWSLVFVVWCFALYPVDELTDEKTMNPTRILPDLQCSLLCEEIRQEINGSFFLIGVINFIRVPKLPVVAFRLCVFNRWAAGLGQFTECV